MEEQSSTQTCDQLQTNQATLQLPLPNQPLNIPPNQLPTSPPNQPPTSFPNQPSTSQPNQPPTSLLNQSPTSLSNQPPVSLSSQPPIVLPNQSPTLQPSQPPMSQSNQQPNGTAEDQKNYDKLQILYRRAVLKMRDHFHQSIPEDPKDLYIELKKYEPDIMRNRKISAEQCLLLFPPNKETYSSKFDPSLFRQLFAIMEPSKKGRNFWHDKPPTSDKSDKANVNRLISERNNIQHLPGHVTNDVYKVIAARIINLLVAFGEDRNSFQNLLPPIQYGLSKPVGNFFGRTKDLQEIHKLVDNGKSDIKRIVVHGMPGLGKSEMVRKYCDQFGERFDYNILWINSTTVAALESCFMDIADYLDLTIKDVHGNLKGIMSIVNSIYNHIRSNQILLVFDDVSDIQTVETYLATHKPSTTILTTQLRNWTTKDYHMHELKRFDEHEGETFLLDNLEDTLINKTQLAEVLKQLGGHPLAIQQFLISIKNTTLSIEKYLDLLRTQTAKLLETNVGNKSAISAIKISTEKLAETESSNLSIEILNTISWLYGDEIPFELLQSVFHECDEVDIDTAIQKLISYSLVSRKIMDSKTIVTVHSLVQKTMMFFQPNDDENYFGKCLKFFGDQLEVEEEISMRMDFGLIWYKHLIHFISVNLNETELQNLLFIKFTQICRTLQYKGRINDLIEVLILLLNNFDSKFGPSHGKTNQAMYCLAFCYQANRQASQAIDLYQNVLNADMKSYGKTDEKTLTTMDSLANCFHEDGRLEEAIKLNEEIIAERIKLANKSSKIHPYLLRTMTNLAMCFLKDGRFGEAIKLNEEIFSEQIKLHGKRHPNTLLTMNNLAECFRNEKRLGEAIKMHEEILSECIKLHGKRHPDTLRTMNNLALCFRDEGRLGEAIKIHEEILAEDVKLYGNRHPSTLLTLKNLAECFNDKGRLEEAMKLNKEILSEYLKIHGKRHPNTLLAMSNLATCFSGEGRFEEAIKMNREILAERIKLHSKSHPLILVTMNNLSACLYKVGRLQEAIKFHEDIFAEEIKLHGKRHPDTLKAMNTLAMLFQNEGRLGKAKGLLDEAFSLSKSHLGENHPLTITILENLTDIEATIGE